MSFAEEIKQFENSHEMKISQFRLMDKMIGDAFETVGDRLDALLRTLKFAAEDAENNNDILTQTELYRDQEEIMRAIAYFFARWVELATNYADSAHMDYMRITGQEDPLPYADAMDEAHRRDEDLKDMLEDYHFSKKVKN